MANLTGEQIRSLALSLSSALNPDDLEDDVQASTGDGLYDVYVGSGKPKLPTIIDLLNQLLQRLGPPLSSSPTFTKNGRGDRMFEPRSPSSFPRS